MSGRNLEVEFEQFTSLQRAGYSAAAIARRVRVSSRTVQRWRGRIGVAAPAPVVRPLSDHERAAQLLAEGCPVAEAARTVGVADVTVAQWFPDAPRWSRAQASELGALGRLEHRLLP